VQKSAISIAVLSLAIFGFGSSAAKADSVAISTSRSGFNDTASWSGTCASNLASTSSTSSNGVTVTATDATGGIATDIQSPPGCSYGGWNGNFAPGDALVYSANDFGTGSSGPITLSFSSPVSGIGTQFQSEDFGSFTAVIQLYDGSTLLGTFTENGVSGSGGNNSAVFLGGIDSTGANITSAVLSVTNTASGRDDFTVNQVSLVDAPEPGTISLLAIGLMAALGLGLRQKQRMHSA
jgi:hypothetical protein